MKPKKQVVGLFDKIAPVYDNLNRVISWGQDKRWRKDLARHMGLHSGQVVLDISAGTGDMEPALRGVCSGIRVLGLDPSPEMLQLYRRKFPAAKLSLGAAEALPFESGSISRVTCTFGLRNFADRQVGYREIHRVLEPQGLWGFLEMSEPTGLLFPWIFALYFKRIMPMIGSLFSPSNYAYTYLRDTVYAFPGYDDMVAEHQAAGFGVEYYRPIMRGAVGLYVFKKLS